MLCKKRYYYSLTSYNRDNEPLTISNGNFSITTTKNLPAAAEPVTLSPNEAVSVAHLPQGGYILQVAGEAVKLIKGGFQ